MSMQVAETATTFRPTPLVVDVDGTLVMTDLLQESALQFVAQYPWRIASLPLWLAQGKSVLKTRLADHVDPGIETVPLRPEVLQLIHEAQAEGQPVYLASASDRRYVLALAERIGGIAGVFGTEEGINLAGEAKARQLVAAFGAQNYDYIGDNAVDFPVWQLARRAMVVAHSTGFANKTTAAFPFAEIVARPTTNLRQYTRSLRMHQWAKNVLLFLPMIAGHRFDIQTILLTLVGFVCFCLAASSAYIVNDLLDLPGDRDHPRKANRPFAAAQVPITHGVAMAAAAMASAFAVSLLLPLQFTGVLAIYVLSTLAYSLVLKRRVLVDVVTLGGLYTVRVYGGLAAIGNHQTPWLLMFSLFLFLSLALVKRCSELKVRHAAGKMELTGRGYRQDDMGVLLPLGAAAGYGAVLVVTLYLSSPEVRALYTYPGRLWLMCPLLIYWVSRVLIKSNRGELHDDPVIFALTDRVSWMTLACVGGVILVSI